MKRALMIAVLLPLGMALSAQAALVEMWFHEATVGEWQTYIRITGNDTAGLSAYSLWVEGVDPTTVSFTENSLFCLTPTNQFLGFWGFQQGKVGANYNVGNFQQASVAIVGVGKVPIFIDNQLPGYPDVDLSVPALLGTFHTPAGLSIANFRSGDLGLLNADSTGYLDIVSGSNVFVRWDYPEPASMSLLAIGGMALLGRRRRVRDVSL